MGCQHSVIASTPAVATTAATATAVTSDGNQHDHQINNIISDAILEQGKQSSLNHDIKRITPITRNNIEMENKREKKNTNANYINNKSDDNDDDDTKYGTNDDFTKDYLILKQIMGGTMNGTLSNIYMVMKRPNVFHHDQTQQQQQHSDILQRSNHYNEAIAEEMVPLSTGVGHDNVDKIQKNDGNDTESHDNNTIYMLQVIDMHAVAPERRKSMRKEILSLQTIIHPNILRVHAVYDATRRDNTIATVSEICTGSHLESSIPYPEMRAKKIIAQILDALQYMHQRGLFHNSLNTENILFQDDSQDAIVKITYAGVSNIQSTTPNRSSYSVIPELNPQGKDMYSVGMITYNLLSGGKEPPTDMDTQRIVPGTNLFLGRRWKLISISKNAKNFIEQCLHCWDVQQSGTQFTVEDAMKHVWMTQEHTHRSDTNNTINVIPVQPQQLPSTPQQVPIETVRDMLVEKESSDVAVSALSSLTEVGLIPSNHQANDISMSAENDTMEHDIDENDDQDLPVFVPMNETTEVVESQNDEIDNSTNTTIPTVDQNDDHTPAINSVIDDPGIVPQPLVDEKQIPNSMTEVPILTSPNSQPSQDEDISDAIQTSDEYLELQDSFEELTNDDNNKGNVVTIDTFKERLRTKYTEDEVNSWFTGTEKYEDSSIVDYKAVIKKVIENRRTIEVQRIDTAFKLIDKGRHGYVTVGNLRAVLGKEAMSNKNIEHIIKTADTKRDGKISYAHFEQVVQNFLSSSSSSPNTPS